MKTNIVKIEGNKIEIVEGNDVKEYELEEWVKGDFVELGEAEVTISNGKITFVTMKKDAPKKQETKSTEKKSSEYISNRNNLRIDERFIVKIQGKEFITYNGLLEYAKTQYGGTQKREIIEIIKSEDGKSVSARVRIVMKEGQIFEDVGTCTPQNSKSVTSYPEELAVTRAYSRALRFGLAVDYCSQEELSQNG